MSDTTIEVQKRENFGKGANRRLRKSGEVPAVVYGTGLDPVPIQINRRTLRELMREGEGDNIVFRLKLAGTDKSRHAMIRDMQIHPVTREIEHLDFLRVNMDEVVRVSVAIELEGTPIGVKNEDGIVDFVTREVEVECLPGSIPGHLSADISELHVGQHLEAGALEMPEGVELITEPERVLVSVAHARVVEVEEGDEDEGLIEAETEEPEVIGRGGDDEDANE